MIMSASLLFFCAYCPYLLRSWLHSVCSISLIGRAGCSFSIALGSRLWGLLLMWGGSCFFFLKGVWWAAGWMWSQWLQVYRCCREPLVGCGGWRVVFVQTMSVLTGAGGDVWACRGEWAGGIVEVVTGVSVMRTVRLHPFRVFAKIQTPSLSRWSRCWRADVVVVGQVYMGSTEQPQKISALMLVDEWWCVVSWEMCGDYDSGFWEHFAGWFLPIFLTASEELLHSEWRSLVPVCTNNTWGWSCEVSDHLLSLS